MYKENYAEVKSDFLKASTEARSKLTVLTATLIAAIYFYADDSSAIVLKLALVCYVFTIAGEIVSAVLKSQHYSLWIDGKIDTTDYRESIYGKLSEWMFWVPIFAFTIGCILFFVGIFI